MKIFQGILCAAVASCCSLSGAAQSVPETLRPDGADLGGPALSLLTEPGRVQQFFQWSELPGNAGQLTVAGVSFRYDGPSGRSPAVEQVIGRVTIRVGVTDHGVHELGAVFDDNLTSPLVTTFDATGYRLMSDGLVTTGAEPWGGPSGQLRFDFSSPVQLSVPVHGCLVVELRTEGALGGVTAPAKLDSYGVPTDGQFAGDSVPEAQGCGYMPTMNPAVQLTDGQYRPGTSFTVSGEGFAPGSIVGTWVTTGLSSTPWFLPGTPGCWSYLDLNTGGLLSLGLANGAGRVGTGEPPLPIPPSPGLCGTKLYIQSAGTAPRTPSNMAGLITSNYRTIRVGCRAESPVRAWLVSRRGASGSRIASRSVPGSLAMRIH